MIRMAEPQPFATSWGPSLRKRLLGSSPKISSPRRVLISSTLGLTKPPLGLVPPSKLPSKLPSNLSSNSTSKT